MIDEARGIKIVGKTNNKRRLEVKKESLRALGSQDLQQVVGGQEVRKFESRYCPLTAE